MFASLGAWLRAQPQAAPVASLRGTVVDAGSGMPLRRARVAVVAADKQIAWALTDDQGGFEVDAPAPPFTLRITKAGYAVALTPIADGRATAEPRVSLVPAASISGRALDPYGAPLRGGSVVARPVGADAFRQIPKQLVATVDDDGEYRLGGLPPARYQLFATPVSSGATMPGKSPTRIEVTVSAGDELRGVDVMSDDPSDNCTPGSSYQAAPGRPSATIRGRVRGTLGEPLACAVVRIASPEPSIPSVNTDRQGRYMIDGVPPGSIVLEARKTGYATLQYGQETPSDGMRTVVVRNGQAQTDVDFALPRPGIISGIVVDEHGEPVEGAIVAPVQLRRFRGRLMAMSPGLPKTTDDRGRYRLLGLPSGSYVIAVSATPVVGSGGLSGGGSYPSTYYPGTTDFTSAVRISVDVGREVSGTDVVITPLRTHTVSGAVFDASGRPLAGEVVLTSSVRSGALGFNSRSGTMDADGRFVLRNVVSGDYVVQAHSDPGPGAQWGLQHVRVGDEAPPPIVITTSPPATVEGRVSSEGGSDIGSMGLLVSIAPADADTALIPGTALGRAAVNNAESVTVQDGRFHFPNVMGPSRVLANASSCDTCYLKSAYVNGGDVTETVFDFGLKGGVFDEVSLVLSDGGGAIEMRATDERDMPVMGFTGVVFSLDRNLWYPDSPHVKVRAVRAGVATLPGLPPGDYYAVAVPSGADQLGVGELEDAATLDALSQRARRVTVGARDRPRVSVPLVRR